VRWVASRTGALTALVMPWKSVTAHLESTAATQKGVAMGLLKKLKDFKFVYILYIFL
jgi:hypothetical protein